MTKIKCDLCNGRGKYDFHPGGPSALVHRADPKNCPMCGIKCARCGGTGKVPRHFTPSVTR